MKTTIRVLFTLLALALATMLSACQNSTSTDSPTASQQAGSSTQDGGTVTVSTDMGEVQIPSSPQRIVVLNYALTGYLFNLGQPVVGTTPLNAGSTDNFFSDNWKKNAEESQTVLLPWANEGYDFEAILALDPDLIIAGGLGFPYVQAKQSYDDLTKIAPTVLVSDSLDNWQEQLEFLAKDVFRQEAAYQQLLDGYDRRVAEVKEKASLPQGPASYLLFSSDMTPYGIPEDTQLPLFFKELGLEAAPIQAENHFELYGSAGDAFELSTEQVSQTYTQSTLLVLGFNSDTFELADLETNDVYASLPAFREGTVEKLPYWFYRPDYDTTMNMLDYVEEHFTR